MGRKHVGLDGGSNLEDVLRRVQMRFMRDGSVKHGKQLRVSAALTEAGVQRLGLLARA
jgi:hypothetical protein